MNVEDNKRERVMSRDMDTIISMLAKSNRRIKKETKEIFRTKSKTQIKKDFAVMEEKVIRCICANIVVFVLDSERRGYEPPKEYSCFNDNDHNRDEVLQADALLREVQASFTEIHTETQMEYECMIVALIYMERLPQITKRKFRICRFNWKNYMFICILLASKLWDDFSVSNADFASLFPNMTISKTNEMEIKLLLLFDFNMEVSSEKYFRLDETIQQLIFAADLNTQLIACGSTVTVHSPSNPDTTSCTNSYMSVSPKLHSARSLRGSRGSGEKLTGNVPLLSPVQGQNSEESRSGSDVGLSKFLLGCSSDCVRGNETCIPLDSASLQARRSRSSRGSCGSRNSHEELSQYLSRTISEVKTPSNTPVCTSWDVTGISPLSGTFLGQMQEIDDIHGQSDLSHGLVGRDVCDYLIGEDADGDGDFLADRDSDHELTESYDDFRNSNCSLTVSMEISQHEGSVDSHGSSPTPSQGSTARRESIERRVSRVMSVLMPSFTSLRMPLSLGHHAKIHIYDEEEGEKKNDGGNTGAVDPSGSDHKEPIFSPLNNSELANIDTGPLQVENRPRAYSLSTAKAKAQATTSSGSFNSRRRMRVHAMYSDSTGEDNTLVASGAITTTEAIDYMAVINKECEDMIRTLQHGISSEGDGVGSGVDEGGRVRKGRSVSYTNAKKRHEAYNYTVMQSK